MENPAVTYSPTGATLQYHRRNAVSLLCSEWEQVVPARYRRRKTDPVHRSLGEPWAGVVLGQLNMESSLSCTYLRCSFFQQAEEKEMIKPHGLLVPLG